jgi:hypothetical protein
MSIVGSKSLAIVGGPDVDDVGLWRRKRGDLRKGPRVPCNEWFGSTGEKNVYGKNKKG